MDAEIFRIIVEVGGGASSCVEDPRKNKLCFVDERTLFTGREAR